jgi:hypothetical protein
MITVPTLLEGFVEENDNAVSTSKDILMYIHLVYRFPYNHRGRHPGEDAVVMSTRHRISPRSR